jgi:ABC-type Fe3+ transport system permease subunit
VKPNTLNHLTAELQHFSRWLSRPGQFSQQLPVKLQQAVPVRLQTQASRLARRLQGVRGWLLGGLGLALLWVWLWQWLLAIVVGTTVMVGVYLTQQGQLPLPGLWLGRWRQLWNRSNRSLSLSILAGLLALGATFLATAVWAESEQAWGF